MHKCNINTGLPPTRGVVAPTRSETQSTYACKAQLMGCHLVYLHSVGKRVSPCQKVSFSCYREAERHITFLS